MYLVDTNILIYYFNGSIPKNSIEKINKIFTEYFNISVITKMEFLGFKWYTDKNFFKAKAFLENAYIFDIDEEITDIVINLRRNKTIKLPDAVIAATTIKNDLTLVTRNDADFKELEINIFNPF